LLASALCLVFPGLAYPQSPDTPSVPVQFRTVCVDINRSIGGIYYDYKTEQVELSAADGILSAPYRCPPSGIVSLYRLLPPTPPETKARREPILDMRLAPGGPWLVLLARDNAGKMHAYPFEQSWESHPAHNVRIFNFSRSQIALKAGSREARLSPAQYELVAYPEAPHLWLKVAALAENNQWEVRTSTPQRVLPGTRATWILLDRPPTPDAPEPRIVVRHLVEIAPPVSSH
jgi:hypothetical protein